MPTSPLTITNEKINSVPLLFGILEDYGRRQNCTNAREELD